MPDLGAKGCCVSAQAEQEVRHALADFAAAYRAQDLEAVLDAWSGQVAEIQHGLPKAEGAAAREVRRATISATFERFEGELAISLDQVVSLSSDWVLVRGELEVRLRERESGERSTRGKRFLEVWGREADRWRIRFGMTNTA